MAWAFLCLLLSGAAFTADASSPAPDSLPKVSVFHMDDAKYARGKRSLSRFLEVLPDPRDAWTIRDVSSPPLAGSFISNLDYNDPVVRHRAYWVRLTIQGSRDRDATIFLSMEWPVIDFYEALPSGGFAAQKTGYFVPFRERAAPDSNWLFPLLPVQVPKGELKTFYWRFAPSTLLDYKDILCWGYSPDYLKHENRVKRLGVGIFLGIIFALSFYHLILFFFVRDKSYLYFGLFSLTFGVYWMYYFGYAAEFLWPGHPREGFYFVGAAFPLIVTFWLQFFKVYLNTGVLAPGSHRIISWIPVPFYLSSAVLPFDFMLFIQLINAQAVILIVFMLGVALLCARKGSRPARVMLAAAGIFLVTMGFYGVSLLGFLPQNEITPFIPLMGLCLFELLFALGIADRLNTLRSEKEWAQAESLRKQEELEQARRLQLSMLPERMPAVPGLDVAAHMQTASEVGGDYYDYRAGGDGALTFVIGDATGHGLKAGTLVTATKSLFNLLADERDVSAAAHDASASLHRMGFKGMFMALNLVKFREGDLHLAGAGMPYPLLYRAGKGTVEEIPLEGLPLGILPDEAYPEIRLSMDAGDTLLLMSDGFVEMLDGKGEMLGFERTAALFREAASGSADEVIERLVRAGRAWAGSRPPEDDVTFLVLRRTRP